MKASDIRVGDVLKLKRDNAYGFGAREVEVTEIVPREGYSVPWIRGLYWWTMGTTENMDFGMFKPSDFAKRA